MNGHVFLGLAENLVYTADGILQGIQGTVFLFDNFFPVPLVYINGMDIVHFFVAADGAHIGIKTFSYMEAVFFQCVTFPFCKRVYNFSFSAVLTGYIKCNRSLYTV